jgi:hypothetical protein
MRGIPPVRGRLSPTLPAGGVGGGTPTAISARTATWPPRAVAQVRRWGGVLEHPAHSRLWNEPLGLPRPGMWPDPWGGITIEVEQGAWGHPAPKKTWIYAVNVDPKLLAQASPGLRPWTEIERMPRSQRHLTPPLVAAWLVELARSASGVRA